MPQTMILELTNVRSLTEARFAAGEGFTHLRLHQALATDVTLLAQIRGFIAGLYFGIDGPAEAAFDYYVEAGLWHQPPTTLCLAASTSPHDLQGCLVVFEGTPNALKNLLAKHQVAGISLQSEPEGKLGYMAHNHLQALAEAFIDHV